MDVHIDNAVAVVEKTVKNGRVVGLTNWEGKAVKVIVLGDSE